MRIGHRQAAGSFTDSARVLFGPPSIPGSPPHGLWLSGQLAERLIFSGSLRTSLDSTNMLNNFGGLPTVFLARSNHSMTVSLRHLCPLDITLEALVPTQQNQ